MSEYHPDRNKLQARFFEDPIFTRNIWEAYFKELPKQYKKEYALPEKPELIFEPSLDRKFFDLAIIFTQEVRIQKNEVYYDRRYLAIDLRPVLGDEYPTILRKIVLSQNNGWYFCVYTDLYNGSVLLDSVKKIFKSRDAAFLTKDDLP